MKATISEDLSGKDDPKVDKLQYLQKKNERHNGLYIRSDIALLSRDRPRNYGLSQNMGHEGLLTGIQMKPQQQRQQAMMAQQQDLTPQQFAQLQAQQNLMGQQYRLQQMQQQQMQQQQMLIAAAQANANANPGQVPQIPTQARYQQMFKQRLQLMRADMQKRLRSQYSTPQQYPPAVARQYYAGLENNARAWVQDVISREKLQQQQQQQRLFFDNTNSRR